MLTYRPVIQIKFGIFILEYLFRISKKPLHLIPNYHKVFLVKHSFLMCSRILEIFSLRNLFDKLLPLFHRNSLLIKLCILHSNIILFSSFLSVIETLFQYLLKILNCIFLEIFQQNKLVTWMLFSIFRCSILFSVFRWFHQI